jgi:hypothetical protein
MNRYVSGGVLPIVWNTQQLYYQVRYYFFNSK